MSDTPRCDDALRQTAAKFTLGPQHVLIVELARQLERELKEQTENAQTLRGFYLNASETMLKLEREHREARPFLKEDETVSERMKRYHNEVSEMMGHLAEVKRELAEARKDAERWRLVIAGDLYVEFDDNEIYVSVNTDTTYFNGYFDSREKAESAIDSAMKP